LNGGIGHAPPKSYVPIEIDTKSRFPAKPVVLAPALWKRLRSSISYLLPHIARKEVDAADPGNNFKIERPRIVVVKPPVAPPLAVIFWSGPCVVIGDFVEDSSAIVTENWPADYRIARLGRML
jgi:hypothetical protein